MISELATAQQPTMKTNAEDRLARAKRIADLRN
jgi:hypothetical protein